MVSCAVLVLLARQSDHDEHMRTDIELAQRLDRGPDQPLLQRLADDVVEHVVRAGLDRQRHGRDAGLRKQLGHLVVDGIHGDAVRELHAYFQRRQLAQYLLGAVLVVEKMIVLEQQDGHAEFFLHAPDIRDHALDRHRAHIATMQRRIGTKDAQERTAARGVNRHFPLWLTGILLVDAAVVVEVEIDAFVIERRNVIEVFDKGMLRNLIRR